MNQEDEGDISLFDEAVALNCPDFILRFGKQCVATVVETRKQVLDQKTIYNIKYIDQRGTNCGKNSGNFSGNNGATIRK